ncbi:FecR domain-containing protein [Telluribacter sp.]|uniref:FecR domain-containing protein n=1 Tax=Telluribacter sp. TaxID=1978767 RepID=UPI002E161D0C|nr:FecR domain-containing protein [Telluribacter sp.]
MNNPNEPISDELLARYLAGSATAAEIDQVKQWLEASPRRATELAAYRKLWERSQAVGQKRMPVNTDAAWEKMQKRMHRAAPEPATPVRKPEAIIKPMPVKRPMTPTLWAAAAVALVALAFGWLFFTHKASPQLVSVSTQNNTFEKTLPDGTKVFLNRNSTLTYPEGLTGDFRTVSLKGEAFFDVAPDASHPFVIDANGTQVRVVGTSFNVKAYDEAVRVDVKSGKVEVSKASRKAILTKGEGVKVEADTIMRNILADPNMAAYRTQVFEFTATSLDEVVQSLRNGYNADVRLSTEQLANCRLTARFERETLDATLAVIAETLNLRLSHQGDTYWLEGTGCQ